MQSTVCLHVYCLITKCNVQCTDSTKTAFKMINFTILNKLYYLFMTLYSVALNSGNVCYINDNYYYYILFINYLSLLKNEILAFLAIYSIISVLVLLLKKKCTVCWPHWGSLSHNTVNDRVFPRGALIIRSSLFFSV